MLTHLATHVPHSMIISVTNATALFITFRVCRSSGPAPTKEDKELLRQKELKQMKVKYGLKVSDLFIHYNFICCPLMLLC